MVEAKMGISPEITLESKPEAVREKTAEFIRSLREAAEVQDVEKITSILKSIGVEIHRVYRGERMPPPSVQIGLFDQSQFTVNLGTGSGGERLQFCIDLDREEGGILKFPNARAVRNKRDGYTLAQAFWKVFEGHIEGNPPFPSDNYDDYGGPTYEVRIFTEDKSKE
jgi:hypothetical protein